MATRSLAFRLFVAAGVTVAVLLLVAGTLLASYYRQATEKAFDERLHVYLKTLVADLATRDAGESAGSASLGEPQFELPLSGWYWQITRIDGQGSETISSKSLLEGALPSLDSLGVEPDQGSLRVAYLPGPDNVRLRAIERIIDLGGDGRFRVIVAGPGGEIDREIDGFERALIITLGSLGAGLVGAIFVQVRFGLRPLKEIRDTLAAMRVGKATSLPPQLPAEIVPLAREIDALVEANKKVVERARAHVGNLAHALKTPLSVIANEARASPPGPLADVAERQVSIMRTQIDHHLQRARIAASVSIVGTLTDIVPVMEGLVRVMVHVHGARSLDISKRLVPGLQFRGERQDLEEMVGNLVDNACKWAHHRVQVVLEPVERHDGVWALISIDDDGPGLPAERRVEASRRGRRLDETKPGSGLGLAIVLDLTTLYGGTFDLDISELGGLKAKLLLPAKAARLVRSTEARVP